LIPLELCQAPFRYFDPQGLVTKVFKINKLKCYEHVRNVVEESFQDVLDYDVALRNVVDVQNIPLTHATNLAQRDHLLEERERLIIAKSQRQETARNVQKQLKKSKVEQSFQKSLELQNKLEDAAIKIKDSIPSSSDMSASSSHDEEF